MRDLSSTLLAAQQSASRKPYMKVSLMNKLCGVNRLEFDRLYTGAENDYYHAMTLPGDGSLVRVRISSGGDNHKLYRQRVANPNPQSDFSQWTYSGQYGCQAVTTTSRGAEVDIFWVDLNQELKWLQSTDYGVTWGSPQSIDTVPGVNVYGITAVIKPNGDIAVFFTSEATLYVKKRVNGNWQEKSAWDKVCDTLTSVAVVYDGDWALLVTGQDAAGDYKVWTLVYGDGDEQEEGSWTDLSEFATAPGGGSYEFRSVYLDKPDVYRAFYVEKFNGTQSYAQPRWSHSVGGSDFIDGLWRELVPFNLASEYGVAIAHHGDYCWLSTPGGVWRASQLEQSLELTDNVRAATSESRFGKGKLLLELRNEDGQYNTPGSGALAVMKPGCEIEFSPGYVTANGNEYSAGQTYWLEGYEYTGGGGKASLILHGVDGWGLLESWRARHQFRWNRDTEERSVKQLMEFVLARVGLKLEVKSQSSLVTGFYPDFTIHPGDDGQAIVEHLLTFIPDLLFIEGPIAYLVNPLAEDSAVYSYGSVHAITKGRYSSSSWPVNHASVEGYDENEEQAIVIDAFQWQGISSFPSRFMHVFDRNIGTTGQAEARAVAILRKGEMVTTGGEIEIPVNCGQQLYDVVEITDGRAGLSAVKRRITGITMSYEPARGEYKQRLLIGGV